MIARQEIDALKRHEARQHLGGPFETAAPTVRYVTSDDQGIDMPADDAGMKPVLDPEVAAGVLPNVDMQIGEDDDADGSEGNFEMLRHGGQVDLSFRRNRCRRSFLGGRRGPVGLSWSWRGQLHDAIGQAQMIARQHQGAAGR